MADEFVRKEQFATYVKGVNGDLADIKTAVATLTDKMDRRFDMLDVKFEQERKVNREAGQRVHERIDGVNESLAVEVAGIGRELAKVKEGHVSKATTAVWTLLTAVALSAITAFVTLLIAR